MQAATQVVWAEVAIEGSYAAAQDGGVVARCDRCAGPLETAATLVAGCRREVAYRFCGVDSCRQLPPVQPPLEPTRCDLLEASAALLQGSEMWQGEGLSTAEFCTAIEPGLLAVMDCLLEGMIPAHGLIRKDALTNLAKIRDRSAGLEADTLHQLTRAEEQHRTHFSRSGREALLWFKRTLQFVSSAIRALVRAEDEQSDDTLVHIVRTSYNGTLSGVHGLKAHAFRAFLGRLCSREKFLMRLTPNDPARAIRTLRRWDGVLCPLLREIVALTNALNLEHCAQMTACSECSSCGCQQS